MQKGALSGIRKPEKGILRLLVIIILLIGLTLSTLLFFFVRHQQISRIQNYFIKDSNEKLFQVNQALDRFIQEVDLLKIFFSSSNLEVSQDFIAASQQILQHDLYRSISWIRCDKQLSCQRVYQIDKSGLGQQMALSFDMEAMQEACNKAQATISHPFKLDVEDTQYYVQLYVPVYRHEAQIEDLNNDNLLGFISTVVRLSDFFDQAVLQSYPDSVSVEIFEQGEAEEKIVYHPHQEDIYVKPGFYASTLKLSGFITFANLPFSAEVLPVVNYYRLDFWLYPFILFILAFLLAVIFIFCIFRIFSLKETTELLLQRRTHLLHSNHELYRCALNSIGDAVLSVDPEGKITGINPVAEKIIGWKEREVVGRHYYQVLHLIDSLTGQLAQNPISHALEFKKITHTSSGITLINRRGESVYISDSGSPILDHRGNLLGAIMVFRDIGTEYEHSQDLKQSEEMFKAIAHHAMDAIILINQAGKIIFWNEAAERMFQNDPSEVMYRDVHQMIAPIRYHEQAWSGFQQYQKSGQGCIVDQISEMEGIKKDGSVFPLELRITPVMIKGERHTVGIIRDISEQKAAREAIQKKNYELQELNERKNELLDLTTHDIRNPLSVIKGYADLLLEGSEKKLSREQAKMIEKIQSSASFVTKLLNDLLDFSAMESGKIEMIKKTQNFTEFVEHITQNMEMLAYEKKISIVCDLDFDLPEFPFDQSRVEQVMQNLISNAIKFSLPDTEIHVSAKLKDNKVFVSICDQGLGIPEEEIEKLFRPFQKTSVKPTAGEKSTGLGLVIAQSIIHAHGGEIWVESKVGLGSTFTFTLPLWSTGTL